MAQDSGRENKNGLEATNRRNMVILGVAAAVLIILGIIWSVRENNDDNEPNNDPAVNVPTEGNSVTPAPTPASTKGETAGSDAGNLDLSGTLTLSDNAAKGNYVLQTDAGKVYVSTSRDFKHLVNKQVRLEADGTLDQFAFIGFEDESAIADDVGDVGGAESDVVTFTGLLEKSNSSKGNYTITSGSTIVYFQTVRDYSSFVGSTVELEAVGTINSFTEGRLIKK